MNMLYLAYVSQSGGGDFITGMIVLLITLAIFKKLSPMPITPNVNFDQIVLSLLELGLHGDLCRRYKSVCRRHRIITEARAKSGDAMITARLGARLTICAHQRETLELALAEATIEAAGFDSDPRQPFVRFQSILHRADLIEAILSAKPQVVVGVRGQRCIVSGRSVSAAACQGEGLAVLRRRDLLNLVSRQLPLIGIQAGNGNWLGWATADPADPAPALDVFDYAGRM